MIGGLNLEVTLLAVAVAYFIFYVLRRIVYVMTCVETEITRVSHELWRMTDREVETMRAMTKVTKPHLSRAGWRLMSNRKRGRS